MGAMRGVAQKDQLATVPSIALDALEVEPRGTANEMRHVRLQRMAIEIFGKESLAFCDALIFTHSIEAQVPPAFLGTFDDEGRAIGREPVGVRPDPAMLRLLEREGKSLERLGCTEPHELVAADVEIDSERLTIDIAKARVDPVRGDDEVEFAPFRIGGIAIAVEVQGDAKCASPGLQDFEQALASDADKTVAAGRDCLAVDVHLNVVPVGEFPGDRLCGDRIIAGDIVDREIGKDDAPAECHVRRIALENLNLMCRVAELHRNREIESRGAAPDAGDPHASTSA